MPGVTAMRTFAASRSSTNWHIRVRAPGVTAMRAFAASRSSTKRDIRVRGPGATGATGMRTGAGRRAVVGGLLALAGAAGCQDAGMGPAAGPAGSGGASSPAAEVRDVCDRTPQVRDALVVATGRHACGEVTTADLAALVSLELSGRSISAVQPSDFNGLSSLVYLDLSENGLVDLAPRLFAGAPQLVVLSLRLNQLVGLPAQTFSGIDGLERLDLFGNRISRPRPEHFAGLSSLQALNLGGNGVSALPDDLFSGLPDLRELRLSFNGLGAWPGGALRGAPRLELLNLRQNGLAEIPAGAFDRLTGVRTLVLADNRLQALPPGLLRPLAALDFLDLSVNRLGALPDSLFAGTGGVSVLDLRENPGTPFRVRVELERADDGNGSTGVAQVRARVRLGAPFPMDVGLRGVGGALSAPSAHIAGGRTTSEAVTATNAAGSSFSVAPVAPSLPDTSCSGLPCFHGLEVDAGPPLMLANPPAAQVTVPAVYLVQAAQTRTGSVPLIAGRRALLRVFAQSDSANVFRPVARATFYRDGAQVHTVQLEPPPGIPQALREGDLGASFNAEIPGSVLQPGVEMVVELDPDRTLPLSPGSVRRVPAEGRAALDVRAVAPLDLTIVPVHYAWDANAGANAAVAGLAKSFRGAGSSARLRYLEALLPLGQVDVRVREPFFTFADTTEYGAFQVLEEIQLLRHVEAGGTSALYHGLFAVPRFVHANSGGVWGALLGVAFQPGHVGISRSHLGDGAVEPEFELTLAHEVGHNLNLGHAPCGAPLGVDEDFPYPEASTGVFGYEFAGPGWPARALDPASAVDLMSYCRPYWISDYNFVKALDYRAASAPAAARPEPALLLSGGARDGRLRLSAPFVWDAPPKLPDARGPYRLTGTDAAGNELFSFSFSADDINHGGSGFLFAVPLEDSWLSALRSVSVRGPDGQATRDMAASQRIAVFADPATGRIRGIARDWPGLDDVPPRLRASGPIEASAGWPPSPPRR